MEVTKWLKPSVSVSRIGDSASVQAVTRVNAEQASGPIQERKDGLVGRLTVDRRLAKAAPFFEPFKAMIGKAAAPIAHNARLHTDFLRDGTRAATLGRQQHNPRPLHVALRRRWRAAPSLKHRSNLRLEPDFSCCEDHPSFESRLTLQR